MGSGRGIAHLLSRGSIEASVTWLRLPRREGNGRTWTQSTQPDDHHVMIITVMVPPEGSSTFGRQVRGQTREVVPCVRVPVRRSGCRSPKPRRSEFIKTHVLNNSEE